MPLKPVPAVVACPRCNRQQNDRGQNAIYLCDNCGAQFDGDPNEGGDFATFNPAARLEREERAREQRAKQRSRR